MHQNNFVIDVNIYVSYIIKAKLDDLFTFILERDLEVFISKRLIIELSEVLNRTKFEKYLKTPANEFVKAVVQFGNSVKPSTKIIKSPDDNDNYLFELALFTNSTIVTGDKQLLNWEKSPVPVISLTKFKQMDF